MSSPHHLPIAKASFAASLLRPDPSLSPVPRENVNSFHSLLDTTVAQCSSEHVQACREWIVSNIVESPLRSAALGKYLAALARSFHNEFSKAEGEPGKKRARPQRKALHVLYVINDLLHWSRFHVENSPDAEIFSSNVRDHLPEIFAAASLSDDETSQTLKTRLSNLLDIWATQGHYPTDILESFRDSKNTLNVGTDRNGENSGKRLKLQASDGKDVPWIMPATHGDLDTPYYDLPAGNFVPYIIEGSKQPIRTRSIKPIHFVAGPADPKLALLVKEFIQEAEEIFNKTDPGKDVVDIDAMGQQIMLNEFGERIVKDSYYGWSREFCERIKTKRSKLTGRGDSKSRTRSGSRSSRSLSRGSSYAEHTRGRDRSYSRDRSPSPRKRRRSYSASRSRSRSNTREHQRRRPGSSERENERSYSPSHRDRRALNMPPTMAMTGQHPLLVPPPPHFLPMGYMSIPPPPPNWVGPWPPPPPPPSGIIGRGVPFPAGVPPPPPAFVPGMGMQAPFPMPFPPPPPGRGADKATDPRLGNRKHS